MPAAPTFFTASSHHLWAIFRDIQAQEPDTNVPLGHGFAIHGPTPGQKGPMTVATASPAAENHLRHALHTQRIPFQESAEDPTGGHVEASLRSIRYIRIQTSDPALMTRFLRSLGAIQPLQHASNVAYFDGAYITTLHQQAQQHGYIQLEPADQLDS